MQLDECFSKRAQLMAPGLIKALESRQFEAYYLDTKEQALNKALSLIPDNASVTWGGSETIRQIGLTQAIKNGSFTVFDRDDADSVEQRLQIQRMAFSCDFFLMSTNALTLDGQLVNIDGSGNRVAALTFGPANVIVVAGMNKVCKSCEDALSRVRNEAAPLNMQRLFTLAKRGSPTPCTINGSCADCNSDECICNSIVITRRCRFPGRIKVLLVGEPLGF